MTSWLLLFVIGTPFIGCLFCFFINNVQHVKEVALATSLITFLSSCFLWVFFRNDLSPNQYQFLTEIEWSSSWNLHFSLGIDGISLFFIILTTFLTPICLLCSWESIKTQTKEFIMLFLLLEGFLMLVFTVLDLILFYIFFESVLIPMFILIGIWGSSQQRIMAAYQLFLYTLLGSVFMLVAILGIYSQAGTADFLVLNTLEFSTSRQLVLWLAFFASFAVKIPMVPVHLWLPKAHVEAPTAGSVILAGILLKLGGYGFLRVLLPLFPEASAFYTPLIFIMSSVAVIYTSLTTLQQTDLKRVIAYSSVGHMGLVTLGLFSGNLQGIEGSIILMISHGVVSGALFLMIGSVYDRHHTREIRYFGGLVYTMPLYAIFFFWFTLANIGLPGTSSFVGEFLVFIGAFQANTTVTVFCMTGVILSAGYSLWLFNRVLLGNPKTYPLEMTYDLTRREFYYLLPCALTVLWLGIYPNVIIDVLHLPVSTLLYQSSF